MKSEEKDCCVLCDGVQGPDHVHVCANCGIQMSPADTLSFGYDGEVKRLYCCLYCHITAEPDGAYAQAIPANVKDRMIKREELLFRQKQLRAECIKEGVPWIH